MELDVGYEPVITNIICESGFKRFGFPQRICDLTERSSAWKVCGEAIEIHHGCEPCFSVPAFLFHPEN